MRDEFAESDSSNANQNIGEAQNVLLGLLSELPDQARTLVDKVNREIDKIQESETTATTQIREKAEQQMIEIANRAETRRRAIFQHAIEQLEPLQKELFRSGDLGKALATFVQIQVLKTKALNVLPDPINLLRFQEIGKTFYFRVTGSNQGPVWGTDHYTGDSHLATAAVHAGAVELGEEGVVRVTVVDLSRERIRGSFANGVMTGDWGSFPFGYRVTANN